MSQELFIKLFCKKSIPTQIHQFILHYTGKVDEFVRELTFAKRLGNTFCVMNLRAANNAAHAQVWGSFWHNGQWGYACCCQHVRNSYCTGATGTVAFTVILDASVSYEILNTQHF